MFFKKRSQNTFRFLGVSPISRQKSVSQFRKQQPPPFTFSRCKRSPNFVARLPRPYSPVSSLPSFIVLHYALYAVHLYTVGPRKHTMPLVPTCYPHTALTDDNGTRGYTRFPYSAPTNCDASFEKKKRERRVTCE